MDVPHRPWRFSKGITLKYYVSLEIGVWLSPFSNIDLNHL